MKEYISILSIQYESIHIHTEHPVWKIAYLRRILYERLHIYGESCMKDCISTENPVWKIAYLRRIKSRMKDYISNENPEWNIIYLRRIESRMKDYIFRENPECKIIYLRKILYERLHIYGAHFPMLFSCLALK